MHRLQRMTFAAALILSLCLAGCSDQKPDTFPEISPPPPTLQEQPADAAASDDTPSQSAGSDEQTTPSLQKISTDSEKHPDAPESNSSITEEKHTTSEIMPDKQEKVDIDLTGFSPNMLYAEVYQMELAPEDYIGKSIKITGEFGRFEDLDESGVPLSDKDILVCVISDAMACCATGLEFVPAEESFFNNYPKDGSKITVTGVCDIFTDESGFFTVIRLNNARIEQAE